MKRFFSLLVLIPVLATAQPSVPIDSPVTQGILLDQGWKWQAGDNPEWADPRFDDQRWQTIDPTQDIMDLPKIRQAGIGWFRLRLVVGKTLRNESLALLIRQIGASEVYVNGRLLYRFGQLGLHGQSVQAYNPQQRPFRLPINADSLQTLAIRFAFANNLLYTTSFARDNKLPLLDIRINDINNAIHYYRVFHWSGVPLDYAKFGLFLILTILHLAFYGYYPIQRANLYLGLFSFCSMLTYLLQALVPGVDDVATSQSMRIVIAVAFNLSLLFQVMALYRLFDRRPGKLYWFLGICSVICIPLTVRPYREGIVYGHGLFLFLCFFESIRVTVLAVGQKKRGSRIVLRGVIVYLVFWALNILSTIIYKPLLVTEFYHTGNPVYYALRHLPYNISFLSMPIAISLCLALEFAFANRTLTAKLREVEDLSTQAQAREAEKLKLAARQNEQLERTVRERTDRLQQQTDKLQELNEFKSRFFTNLTHEFRTPLTLILGPAEQVLAKTKESQTKQQVGLIQRNGTRLLQLINQLLDLSKLESGKMSLSTAPGDLVSLVRGTLHSFESIAERKAITLQFMATQSRMVNCFDHDKLEKILYNLLANALRFTPDGGRVSVSLSSDEPFSEGWIELSIEDTGAGIPTSKQPYIFDRFYQADASDTREQEGTGIGLALTKELVELHGGTIHLSSREGIGTLVIVRLPMQSASSAEVITELTELSDRSLIAPVVVASELEDAPLVLLIEDNDDVRAFIRSSLTVEPGVESYRVIEAPNGEAGLQLAKQQVPDLVITDLMMPKTDGYTVCKSLKQDERTSHIPVIMLTARADLESKLEGLATGADVYLAKPFSQRELVAHLTNLIAIRRQLQQRYSQNTPGQSTPGQHIGWLTQAPSLPSMEQVFLNRVRAAIESHLDDEGYSVERLSDEVGLSRTQLHRKLKALTNEAPGDLIRVLRLQRAHALLKANVGTVAEVAYQVGFGNPANFSTSFSRHFGYPPGEVRRKSAN